jgi:basic amino acid/polyamine antiporter, APA family
MKPAVAATTKALQGDAALVKAVGVGGLTASIINIIVGGGIFLLPATLALQMGAAAPLSFLAAPTPMWSARSDPSPVLLRAP